ncbi:uncharacterized protein YndB with AHSA1/START domain [Natronospira proteinivora]|uniref:Uncharacterized protein YndB with AHSA1/START domain n=1 Tax=Natronospira proteinivora TaxID=1807133 RepID=A0ABT1GB42_9GAMM|nr:SRPBCC family protein [Natronospira proteinivora]MCP1728546.1 uncharacterized protein YndB with AHSA1/START domain [Natronospira proteinivora]
MSKLIYSLGLLLAALLLLVIIALFMPAQVTVERSLAIQAPPSLIHDYLIDPEHFPDWSPWAQRDPAMEIHSVGEDRGEGLILEWQSEREPDGRYEVRNTEDGAFVVHHLSVGPRMSGEGRFEIEPERTRQRVTWSVDLEAGANPLDRYMIYFRQDALGESMLSGLTHLKVRTEADRTPFPEERDDSPENDSP